MSDDGNGFVSRWSRRKRATRDDGGPAATDEPQAATREVTAAAEPETPSTETVADLPDVETLDENSDFSVFLREGVPDALRRQALRRLWRLNPVFANLDGLNDYDEDFTNAATVIKGLKTAYVAGRGFVVQAVEGKDAAAQQGESAGQDRTAEGAETASASSDADAAAERKDRATRLPALEPPGERLPDGTSENELREPAARGAAAAPSREPLRRTAAPRRSARSRRWGDSSSSS